MTVEKLDPRIQFRNPIMFLVYVSASLTALMFIVDLVQGEFKGFEFQVALWLWLTVIFAGYAESLAESRGKAVMERLQKPLEDLKVFRLEDKNDVLVSELNEGDCIFCPAGVTIPADGEVIEGIASVDESAITGESAPVIRESGGDRSAVTEGTHVVSEKIVVRLTAKPGQGFLERMLNLMEANKTKKSSNEVALNVLLSGMSLILLLMIVSLKFFGDFSAAQAGEDFDLTIAMLAGLFVSLLPSTIAALRSAISIAGMDHIFKHNVVTSSGQAVEASSNIDLLMLDKTGTVTLGNRMATEFVPALGVSAREFAEIAQLASLMDETPEGRSIVVLAKKNFDLRGEQFDTQRMQFIPFTPETRMSGVDVLDEVGKTIHMIRKGAVDVIKNDIEKNNGTIPDHLKETIEDISRKGGTPILLSDNHHLLGVIQLQDIIKGGVKERFEELRRMGLSTLMVTGDNPITAAAIAAEAGIDDFLAEATPEMKLERIRKEQSGGKRVAMTGDGTSDAPALAQADLGVAMNTGTQDSREASHMVDLDSNPTKLIEIVRIGKQLLMTRGALTMLSFANDMAKYSAILPLLFGSLYSTTALSGPLSSLNILSLHSKESAIISVLIYNALSILVLLPLAITGVSYKPGSSRALLRKNMLIYGLGGIVVPFFIIKGIDLLLTATGWAS